MKGRAPLLLSIVLLAATTAAARQVGADEPAVAVEWRARAWALEPEGHAEAIDAALAGPDWVERRLALDACGRLGSSARAWIARRPEAFRSALTHGQPNVRAAAWGVFAAAGELPPFAVEALPAACSDRFPGVRRALVELCAGRPRGLVAAERRARLAQLAAGEGAVAADARRLLLQEGVGVGDELRRLWGSEEELLLALVEAWPFMTRVQVDADLVQLLRELAELPSADGRAIAALAEAFALHGERDGAPVRANRERLAETWDAGPAGDDARDPFLRQRWTKALRAVAAEGDDELGRRLFERTLGRLREGPEGTAEEVATEFLVEGAALALEPDAALRAALALPDGLAGLVWLHAGSRLEVVDAPAYEPWLEPARDEEVRFAVATALADVYSRTGDPGAEVRLVALLEDADSGLRRAVFRWLCDGPRFAELMPRLAEAWRSYAPDERWIQLRSLPRGRALPAFRDDLLALCAAPENRRAEVLELLGAQPEGAVRNDLRAWLSEALAGLEGARDGREYAVQEGRATALVEALAAGPSDDRTIDALLAATRRALAAPPGDDFAGLEPELPKTGLALLGGSAAGRARLGEFLGPEVARRARVEAAIQLLRAPDRLPVAGRAVEVLVEDHDGCDAELGARVLAALGRADEPSARAFLAEVATRPRVDLGRRLAAISALARSGGEPALGAVVERFGESETGIAAVAALGRAGSQAAAETLRALWPAEGAPVLRGELLVALAARGELGGIGFEEWLARPSAAAAEELTLRFAGRARGAVEFRWDPELRAAEVLAVRGELGAALAASEAPWRLDGELLAKLSERAANGGALVLARRLGRAAHVAMVGEGLDDARAHDRRFTLTRHRLDVALALRDYDGALDAARELTVAFRLDRPRSNAIQVGLGSFDRRAGVDPGARLDVLVEQLLAARDLAAGHAAGREAAAAHLEKTRARLGASAAAAALQAELEALLRDSRGR